jgi:hypothetical protein
MAKTKNKIQQTKAKLKRQVLRTRSVPEKLDQLIQLVNSIPPAQELPYWTDIWIDYLKRRGNEVSMNDIPEVYTEFVKQLPERVQNLIGPIRLETDFTAGQTYSFIRDGREILRQIARINNAKGEVSLERYSHLSFVRLKINDQGKLTFILPELVDILEGVEASRIKICRICENIYWAGRIDQPTCSKKCGQTLRVRRWRGNYLEKYKPQRILKESSLTDMRSKKGRK